MAPPCQRSLTTQLWTPFLPACCWPTRTASRSRAIGFPYVVWGYAVFPTTRTVDNHIVAFRAKLEPDPDHPR